MTATVPASVVAPSRVPGAGLNPLARLAAGLLLPFIVVWSIDPVSAGVALALELALIPVLGVGWRRFWRRTAVVWIAAPLSAITFLLYAVPDGRVYLEWGLLHVSDGSILLAASAALRVLALALPAVTLFVGVDPTDLADALAQLGRLPARFVVAALAAFRLVALLRDDVRMLELARRARGVADTGRVRRFLGIAFAVLVLAIRRGSALATAMEARGFGGPTRRSWARVSRWRGRDTVLLLVAAAIGAVAVAAAVLTGWWNPVV